MGAQGGKMVADTNAPTVVVQTAKETTVVQDELNT